MGVVHLTSPRENLHPNFFFGNMMHEGSLDFREKDPDVEALAKVSASVPTIAIIFCVRTPTIGVVDQLASRVIGEWGLSDAELVQVLRSDQPLTGHAPVARPNSMEAVLAHPGDAFDLWD